MKYALVTGGSRGIGRAICLSLAESGYNLLINYKSNLAEAEKTLALVREKGSDGEILKFDVGNGAEIEKVLGDWIEANADKPIEVLVNNAGIRQDVLLMWMKAEEWHNVLNPTLDGFFYVTRLVIKSMLMKKIWSHH
jgi:3-oxoacyl-[acyl-carrier protein] reductase